MKLGNNIWQDLGSIIILVSWIWGIILTITFWNE